MTCLIAPCTGELEDFLLWNKEEIAWIIVRGYLKGKETEK